MVLLFSKMTYTSYRNFPKVQNEKSFHYYHSVKYFDEHPFRLSLVIHIQYSVTEMILDSRKIYIHTALQTNDQLNPMKR